MRLWGSDNFKYFATRNRVALRFLIRLHRNERANVQPHPAAYVPKHDPQDLTPWKTFGGTKEEYERWVPHSCGVCCLKMVGDTLGLSKSFTLLELTRMCTEAGGFVEEPDGSIKGVFHFPLLAVARKLGMSGVIVANLDTDSIADAVGGGHYVILSINLARVDPTLQGSHLVLIHGYDSTSGTFTLHDCAATFGGCGENVGLDRAVLSNLSNNRGLILW